MSALTRSERMDDFFPDMFRRFMRTSDWPAVRAPSEMKIDVTENDKAYLVKAEIPGAKKDDVRVSVEGNFVSISAEVKEEKESRGSGHRDLVKELYYGSLSRGFSLAHEVNDKEAQAKFENGVLSLTLPKRTEAAATTVKIS
jgi:HSP20 family protein